MSKELILLAYSISNFLPRFNFFFFRNYYFLIYFICSITQKAIASQSTVEDLSKGSRATG